MFESFLVCVCIGFSLCVLTFVYRLFGTLLCSRDDDDDDDEGEAVINKRVNTKAKAVLDDDDDE